MISRHGLLFGPGGKNAGGTNRPDAGDLAQPVRCGLDNIEDLVAKGPYHACGNRSGMASHGKRRGSVSSKTVLRQASYRRRSRRMITLAVAPLIYSLQE